MSIHLTFRVGLFCLLSVSTLFAGDEPQEKVVGGEDTPSVEGIVLNEFELGPEPKVLGPEEMEFEEGASMRILYLELPDGTQYVVPDGPFIEEQRALFSTLTAGEQERFQEKRLAFLNKLIRLLHSSRLAFGVGVAVKDKVRQVLPSKRALIHPIRTLRGEFPVEPVSYSATLPSLGQKGRWAIQNIVHALDAELWGHSPVITRAEEFGWCLSVGGSAGAMVLNKGVYLGLELGISISHRPAEGILSFDIFTDLEQKGVAVPLQAKVAINAKLMRFWSARGIKDGGKPLKGKMRYTAIPAAFDTSDRFYIGHGNGVGLPPMMMNVYLHTEMTRVPWLHISMGKILPKFYLIQGELLSLPSRAYYGTMDMIGFLSRQAVRAATAIGRTCKKAWRAFTSVHK